MDGRSLTSAFLLLLSLEQVFPVVGQTTVDLVTTEGFETTQGSQPVINVSLRSSLSVLESEAFVRIFIDVVTNFHSVSDIETILLVFSFTDGSTTGSSDYGPVVHLQSQTFAIAADTTEVSFDILIRNDEIVETDETFHVILTAWSGNDVTLTATTGMRSTTVTILDDDTAVISITDGTGNGGFISQNSNHAVLRVSSTKAFQDDVTIDLHYSGYTNIFSGNPPSSIVLPAGSTSQTIPIPLVSGRDEGRQVTVTATASSNNPPVTISQPSLTFTTSDTIINPVRIGFSSSSFFVTEGETTRIQLSASSPVPVTFQAGLIASGNVNDIVIENTATFTTGELIAFIPVRAISDSIPEPGDSVVLSIDPSSFPNGFVVDPNSATATLVIIDMIDATPSPLTPPIVVPPFPPVTSTVATTPRSAYIIAGVVIGLLSLVFIILCLACCCLYFTTVRPIRSTGSYDVTPYERHPEFQIVRKRYIDDFYY